MPNYSGYRIKDPLLLAKRSKITLSGTVVVDGTAVERKILIYKNSPDISYSTYSDASGNWSKEIEGGSNDKFRAICVGESGENSAIYEHV